VKPTSLTAQSSGGTCQLDKSIDEDLDSGKGIAVNQTPTILIIHAGRTDRIAGVVSYPVLKAYFDQLLAH
jgi:protein-disulfide isomerase